MFNINFSYCSLSSLFLFPSHGRYWKKDYLLHLAAAFNTAILALPSSVSFFFFGYMTARNSGSSWGSTPLGFWSPSLVFLRSLPSGLSPPKCTQSGVTFFGWGATCRGRSPAGPTASPPVCVLVRFFILLFHSRLRGWFVLSWWSIITSKTRYKK